MSGVPDQELFQLPDGSMVATGNLLEPEDQRVVMFSEFPESEIRDPKDIERSLRVNSVDFYLEERKRNSLHMINQSTCSKCNASAATGGIYQVADNDGMVHVPLADNWLYLRINGGVDRGSGLSQGMREIEGGGIPPRTITVNGKQYRIGDLVYNISQIPAEARPVATQLALQTRSFEAFRVPKQWDKFKAVLATAAALRYPVVMAMHVGSRFTRLTNGFVQPANGVGNHAMLFHSAKWIGGNSLVHLDIKNSWGPTKNAIYGPMGIGWGDGGFGLCTMEQAFACVRYHDFYVIRKVRWAKNLVDSDTALAV